MFILYLYVCTEIYLCDLTIKNNQSLTGKMGWRVNRERVQAARAYTLMKFGFVVMFFYYPSYIALGNYPNLSACGLSATIGQGVPLVQIRPFTDARAIGHRTPTPHKPSHSHYLPAVPANQLPTSSRREGRRDDVSAQWKPGMVWRQCAALVSSLG